MAEVAALWDLLQQAADPAVVGEPQDHGRISPRSDVEPHQPTCLREGAWICRGARDRRSRALSAARTI